MAKAASFTVIALGAALGCASSPTPGAAGAAEDTSGDDANAKVIRIPVGGCAETTFDQGVRRIDAKNAGWSYAIPADTDVQCEEHRVVFAIGPGLNVIMTSFATGDGGAGGRQVAPIMLATSVSELRQVDPDADVGEAREGRFGESNLPGLCRAIAFRAEGTSLRSLVCAGWAERSGGVVHMIYMGLTDAAGAMEAAGLTDDAAFGNMVDNWIVPAE
jgi:hypothetical protein